MVALVVGVSVLLSGCVSLHSVPPPVPGQPQTVSVKVGDKIEVQTTTGEKHAFTVAAIGPDTFVGNANQSGNEVRVRYQDIAPLRVERIDKVRTAAVVVVGIVVVLGVAVAASGGVMAGYEGGAW